VGGDDERSELVDDELEERVDFASRGERLLQLRNVFERFAPPADTVVRSYAGVAHRRVTQSRGVVSCAASSCPAGPARSVWSCACVDRGEAENAAEASPFRHPSLLGSLTSLCMVRTVRIDVPSLPVTVDGLRRHVERYGTEGVKAVASVRGLDLNVRKVAELPKRQRRTTGD
jgi:hypothetical protein